MPNQLLAILRLERTERYGVAGPSSLARHLVWLPVAESILSGSGELGEGSRSCSDRKEVVAMGASRVKMCRTEGCGWLS